MKNLLYISIFICIWVALQELAYLDSSLGLVIFGLAFAIGLQGVFLIHKNKINE
jgi:hypothetical protein